jgi:cyclopropane fatty-acyl-phospholipid synthase-like methyltransferase
MKLTKQRLKEIIKEEIRNLSEAKMVQLQIKEIEKKKVKKILDKLRLKMGKHYDFGVGKGSTFILELDTKFEDKVLEMLINNRINVQGA